MTVMSVISDVATAHRKLVNLGRQFDREISKGAAHARVNIMGLGAGLQQSIRGLEALGAASAPTSRRAADLLKDAALRLTHAEESARVTYVNLGRRPGTAHSALKGSREGIAAAARDVHTALRELEWDSGRLLTRGTGDAPAGMPAVNTPAFPGIEALRGQMAG